MRRKDGSCRLDHATAPERRVVNDRGALQSGSGEGPEQSEGCGIAKDETVRGGSGAPMAPRGTG